MDGLEDQPLRKGQVPRRLGRGVSTRLRPAARVVLHLPGQGRVLASRGPAARGDVAGAGGGDCVSLVLAEPRGLELLAELARTGAITRTGLYLDDPALPYERFEAVCALLGQWHESIRFALGDAILLGEALYGEQAYQAIESLGQI